MSKTIKYLTLAALSLGALAMAPQDAKAGDYCREYTRNVYIGGRMQEAYGTACLQPNGDWMIVGEGLGNDISGDVTNVNYIIHDGPRNVTPTRVVYYQSRPTISYRPSPIFIWTHNGYYRGGRYVPYRQVYYKNNNWNNGWHGRGDSGWHGRGNNDWHGRDSDRWDRDDHREGLSIRYDWRD